MSADIRCDVAIVGAGIAGLMLALKLSRIGLSVGLIEKENVVCSGASTRNEGWLHFGTYHAVSITNTGKALSVASRVKYGHDQILQYCPECVESKETSSLCIIKDTRMVDDIESRWESANVPRMRVSRNLFDKYVPECKYDNIADLFLVNDKSIDTRILYRKLYTDCLTNKVIIEFNTKIIDWNGSFLTAVRDDRKRVKVIAHYYVYTAGYGMTVLLGSIFNSFKGLRFNKSHLLITERMATNNIFFVDKNEAAVMNHGKYSIVGLNEDAYHIDELNLSHDENKVVDIRNAIQRMFKKDHLDKFGFGGGQVQSMPVACIKVDMPSISTDPRSLDVSIRRLDGLDNHLVALPGKMTEAPYLVDTLVGEISNAIPSIDVSNRPCDALKLVSNGGIL